MVECRRGLSFLFEASEAIGILHKGRGQDFNRDIPS
jgi:hypothetical protein